MGYMSFIILGALLGLSGTAFFLVIMSFKGNLASLEAPRVTLLLLIGCSIGVIASVTLLKSTTHLGQCFTISVVCYAIVDLINHIYE